jgi:hypothetical protein
VDPTYNGATTENDIAIIKLAWPATAVTTYATPVFDSPGAAAPEGTMTTVIGWGATSEGGSGSQILQEVDVPITSEAFCSTAYGPSYSAASMICAGVTEGGIDACQGDSGGPLVLTGTTIQVGIVSWGAGCARPEIPGVYTRLANYQAFVSQALADPGCTDIRDCGDGLVLFCAECTCEGMGGNMAWLGDGYCDSGAENTVWCDYDNGDCCEETCVSSSSFSCGDNGYNCLDPDVGAVCTDDPEGMHAEAAQAGYTIPTDACAYLASINFCGHSSVGNIIRQYCPVSCNCDGCDSCCAAGQCYANGGCASDDNAGIAALAQTTNEPGKEHINSSNGCELVANSGYCWHSSFGSSVRSLCPCSCA